MGGMADDFRYGGINPARGASHLASAGAGGCAHSSGELFYRLVSLSRSQARQNDIACPAAARTGRDTLIMWLAPDRPFATEKRARLTTSFALRQDNRVKSESAPWPARDHYRLLL